MRRAFTMLEMIFVIAIMGFISVMTFGMIAQYYEAFIQKEAAGQLETETKVIVESIAAHLQNAIKESVVVLDGSLGCADHISGYASGQASLPGIAWVEENVEGRLGVWDSTKGYYAPSWSGYVDIASSDTSSIVSPSSDFVGLENIIFDLSGQSGSVNSADNLLIANNFAALYFVGDGSYSDACGEFINTSSTLMHPISTIATATNTYTIPASTTGIKEHYKLAWSAYAIVLNGTDLDLVYNFRPWGMTKNTIALGDRTTLGKNISTFAVKYESGLIRFNVCVTKNINGYDATICKEKVVF